LLFLTMAENRPENTTAAGRRPFLAGFRSGRYWWLLTLFGGGAFLLWAWLTAWQPAVEAVDINQSRLNVALPAPQPTVQIRQTFTPAHDGLNQIELTLVRHDAAATNGRIDFQLLDGAGRVVAGDSLANMGVAHNQRYTLHFSPQPKSAGQSYNLLISGSAGNILSVWGYELDVHSGGQLAVIGQETAARELRFVTRYRLTAGLALSRLGQMLWAEGGLTLLILAFVTMPGGLVLLAIRRHPALDPAAWWGLAVAGGAALWPLLWLWFSLVGGRWRGWSLWLVLATGYLTIFWLLWWRRREGRLRIGRPSHRAVRDWLLLLLLLGLGLAVRLLAVRDLAFPPWVDAGRHGLITALMVEQGQTLTGYRPLLPIDRFPYHHGFHTLAASLAQMSGWPLQELLLVLGQVLNSLLPLTVYAAGWLMSRQRSVGLLAAFLVALPFFFPAYYATWGRLTQLTAMLILPAVLGLIWQVVRGPRAGRRWWPLLAVLVAGLFLVHFRIFLLYLPFAAVIWLTGRGRNGRRLLAAAGLALLLVAPRVAQLAADTRSTNVFYAIPGYNEFPAAYLAVGWERPFLLAGGAAILLAAIAGLWRRRWAVLPLLLAAWVGLSALSLAGRSLGLPETWLININSAYISLFLPQALLLAAVVAALWRWLRRRGAWLQAAAHLVAGALLAALLLFGVYQQVTILNPDTILAEPADAAGLDWVQEHLPADARLANNSWLWLARTWAGSDGGAWLLPLTGRQSTTPPADYIYNRDLAEAVNSFNEQISRIEDWSDPAAANWLAEQGVSHVFVGARGGFLDPAALTRNPALELLYGRDGVFVFATRSGS
jgi:hypothetical protein